MNDSSESTRNSVFGEPIRVEGVGTMGMAVALDGNRLFAGAGPVLYALDVSDALHPRVLGSLGGFDNLRQIRVRGNFVYVVSRETGLRIVDVSDPAHMVLRSRYDTVEMATGIEVAGNIAFVSQRIYGIEAVDVSDPDLPAHIAMRKTYESQSCRYRDGYLYSGEWGCGEVTVFDARDMRDWRVVGKAELGGHGDGLELDGKLLFCSTGHHSLHRGIEGSEARGRGRGLDIFDINEPATPRHIERVDFPRFLPHEDDYWTVRTANGLAFCCDSHNGLFAVDVGEVAHGGKAAVTDRLCIPDPARDWPSGAISSLEVGEGCVYVTCRPGGLFVIPVDGVRPQERPLGVLPVGADYREKYPTASSEFHVWRPDAAGQARAVAIRGDIAYASFGDAGLHVLKLSGNGFEPLGELPGNRRVTDCCFAGDRLLTAEGLDGFALYDLDGPAGFREVARRPGAGTGGGTAFWCWAPDASHVVLSARDGAYAFLRLADFADPDARPVVLDRACSWDRYPADLIAADGAYPVIYPYAGIAWLDLSGEKPRIVRDAFGADGGRTVRERGVPEQRNGICRFGDGFLCTVADGYVLLSPDGSATPWRRLGPDGHRGAPRTDGRLVVLTERSGRRTTVWDFADPSSPRLLRDYLLSGNPDLGAFWRGRAVIPAGHQGLVMEKSAFGN